MNSIKYTALIRTHNSFPVVANVVCALKAQTMPPDKILAVDSASSSEQKLALIDLFDQVIEYPKEPFNFSKAINIGVAACNTEYVLIISSHVVITDPEIINRAVSKAVNEETSCLGYCFYPSAKSETNWLVQKINKHNFSPTLGLSNSCAFLKKQQIVARPFREDVFSAEDQEWSAYYLRNHNSYFFGISSYHIKYLNKHTNDLKKINEQRSMADFTHRQLLSPKYIIARFLRSLFALARKRPDRARLHMTIAKELLLAHFRKPIRKSSYY
jgi:glycosyltransferase involved in cell wall biosynthesis